jgi:hypothetical protein
MCVYVNVYIREINIFKQNDVIICKISHSLAVTENCEVNKTKLNGKEKTCLFVKFKVEKHNKKKCEHLEIKHCNIINVRFER